MTVAVTALASTGVVGVAAPALADIETRGTCSSGSAWEADIEREYQVYGIDFEVETEQADENWRLTVQHNGKTVYANTRMATMGFNDRYADVDWDLVRPDRRGVSDRFVLTAKNLTTGEVCRATVRG